LGGYPDWHNPWLGRTNQTNQTHAIERHNMNNRHNMVATLLEIDPVY
jgi:hypothetical protein